tara:strand:- start:264 stop:428 length:165 start_codon:yes stop_codon:yes gene_type:complete
MTSPLATRIMRQRAEDKKAASLRKKAADKKKSLAAKKKAVSNRTSARSAVKNKQ